MVTQWFSPTTISISACRTSLRISNSVRAENVTDPGFSTVALYSPRIPISKSVARISNPSGFASKRILARMGMVLRFSTTPCTRCNAVNKSSLAIRIFMDFLREARVTPCQSLLSDFQVSLEELHLFPVIFASVCRHG